MTLPADKQEEVIDLDTDIIIDVAHGIEEASHFSVRTRFFGVPTDNFDVPTG